MNVVEILNTFSMEERSSFVRFCQSPYFRVRPITLELFRLLDDLDPAASFDPKTMWKQLFPPDKPYNDATFRKIRSELYHDLGRFLSFESFGKRVHGEFDFLSELYQRRLWPLWKREFKRLQDCKEAISARGANRYYRKTQLAYAGFGGAAHVQEMDSRAAFRDVEQSLDRYYLVWKLRMVVNRLVYAGIFEDEEDFSAEQIIGSGLVNRHLDDPLISIYYRLYNLYAGSKEHLFSELVDSLNKLEGATPEDRYEIGSHILNYALRKANNGSREYMKAAFSICLILLENGDIFCGKQITGHRYITVVRYGLAMGKRKFVKKFMRTHGKNIAGKDGKDYRSLAWSTLHFYEGRLPEAVQSLPDAERKNVRLDLNVRILKFRILFELEDEEAENCFNSMKMKIHRLGKQGYFSPEYMDLFRRMVLVMSKLLRADPDDDMQVILAEAGDLPAELCTWVTKMVLRKRVHVLH
jgi:hypothetical protein